MLFDKVFGGKLYLTLNIILFIVKIAIGVMSNSIAILSDAFNSFLDIISSIAVYFSVKTASKKADLDHPFGHFRAEPLGALFIAMMAGIFGFEVLKTAIERFVLGSDNPSISVLVISIMFFTIIAKILMMFYFSKQAKVHNSPAFRAVAIDSRNDVFSGFVVLVGITGSFFCIPRLDAISGIIIGMAIIFSGIMIAKDNIDYLMGKAPSNALLKKIRDTACSVEGVKGTNTINAHYVGNVVDVELHIEVGGDTHTKKSHDIAKEVGKRLEQLPDIHRAFIHVDPV